MEQRKKKTEIPVGLLLWKDQYPLMELEKLRNMLVQSEKLLAQLPKEKAAVARLIETLLTAAHYSWNVLGYLYLSMEKMEAAIESIKRAQLIALGDLHTYYSLAVCYYKNDQMDECIKEIIQLGRISSDQDVIQSACVSIMTNKANDAYIQLKQVVENGRIAKHQILRDPNLQILLKPYKNMIFN